MTPDIQTIPWTEVPEGPVWFQPVGSDQAWELGDKESYALFRDGQPYEDDELDRFEFALAEQYPGQHAAELADLRKMLGAELQSANAVIAGLSADLARLREGIAGLAKEMNEIGVREQNTSTKSGRVVQLVWADRLTALLSGTTPDQGATGQSGEGR